jgi:glutamate-1-semialdehyde aminotransferase
MVPQAEVKSLARSRQLHQRACEIILGGAQTISKQPQRYDPQRFPAFMEHATGCRTTDLDGNEYIDYVMALGPIVLGYGWPAVDEAVRRQLEKGVLFSSSSPLEVELAERLVSTLPNAECVRFFKSGAEATAAAVRLARAFTGRSKVVSVGYHGWHDWWGAKNRERGVPEVMYPLTMDLPYGNLARAQELFERHGGEVAAIILEPVVMDLDARFVSAVAALARQAGALVIFDEIITGFRTAPGGMQEYLGVDADLATYGKAIANGFPLSVVAGRREIFDSGRDLWISTTFGGEALSLAAALATMDELQSPGTTQLLWSLGERLAAGWRTLLAARPFVAADVRGFGPLPVLQFRPEAKRQEDMFVSRMLDAGFLTRRAHYWFVTASHTTADIDATLEACAEAFNGLALAAGAR